MSISLFNNTISTSSTPVLIGTNPIPDGKGFIYINQGDSQLFGVPFLTWQGNILYDVTAGLAGNTEVYEFPTLVQPLADSTNLYLSYVWNDSSDNGFYVYSDVSETGVSVNLSITPASMTGTISENNVYTSSGLVNSNITWVGSTTTTGGEYSVNISSAGFTSINSVNATAVDNTGTATAVPLASIRTVSTTSITGNVVTGTNIGALGGSSCVLAGTGLTVYVTVYGQ